MKILFISHYSEMYGANKSLINLIEGLIKIDKSLDIQVLLPRKGSLSVELERKRIPFIVEYFKQSYQGCLFKDLPVKSKVLYLIKELRDVKFSFHKIRKVKKSFGSWKPDIVYTNSSVINIGFFLAKSLGVPHAWHIREFGDLDFGLYPQFGKRFQNMLFKASDHVICISRALKGYIFPNDNSKNISIIYNGVSFRDEMCLHKSLKAKTKKTFNFLILGRVQQAKRQDLAISAYANIVKKYPETVLTISGVHDAQYMEKLSILISKLKLQHKIRITGHVNNPIQSINEADALLMCSPNEAMGRVTAEAMAYGVPVIGNNGGATSELIQDGHTGLLFDGSVEGLSVQMVRLLENPFLSSRISDNAFHYAIENFSIENYSSKVYNTLISLMKDTNQN